MPSTTTLPVASSAAPFGVSEPDYLASQSFDDHLDWLQGHHPALARCIDQRFRDPLETAPLIAGMNRSSWEFEDAVEGRGVSYNAAQTVVDNRRNGMLQLLALFSDSGVDIPGPGTLILDALAGDGTIRRFVEASLPGGPEILCADISRFMIERCREQGFPCLRQSASRSLIANGRLDGVLIAYGSHHMNDAERQAAACEAHRTLRPGGRFVLHDFPEGGAVDAWFARVVHPYSVTGHPHRHFNSVEMSTLLDHAGFAEHRVFEMSDPFVVPGTTVEDTHLAMLRHLHAMYGLDKLSLATEGGAAKLADLVSETMGEIRIEPAKDGAGHVATLDRTALIAVGTR